jgi:hypothetical protein
MKIINKMAATALGVFLAVGAMGDFESTGYVSGNELCSLAISKTDESEWFIIVYTAGVLNAHGYSMKMFNDSTVRHWKSIYVSYLERYPKFRDMNAALSIIEALRELGVLVDQAQDKKGGCE